MENNKPLYGIVELLKYDIIVPFICYKCGECCRGYSPQIPENTFPLLADYLNDNIEEIKLQHRSHYLSQNSNIPKNCLFLNDKNECKIYPLRPDPCRLFPFTDFGSEGTNCTGHKEFKLIVSNLFKGRRYAAMWGPGKCNKKDKPRAIPDRAWPKIYQKFIKSNPSKLMHKEFIRMNRNYKVIK